MNLPYPPKALIFYGFEAARFDQAAAALPAGYYAVNGSEDTLPKEVLQDCPAAFFQVRQPVENTIRASRTLLTQFPQLKTILCSTFPIDEYLELAFANGISGMLNVADSEWTERFPHYCRAMLTPAASWSARSLLNEGSHFHNVPYEALIDREFQREAVLSFFLRLGLGEEQCDALRLALDEMLNNARYHGLGESDHQTPASEELDAAGRITIEFGLDAENGLLSVMDSAGRLEQRRVIETLVRQIQQKGTFDTRGRGLYLMRNISDEMYFHVIPGRLTRVALLFGRRRNPLVKSLQFNVW